MNTQEAKRYRSKLMPVFVLISLGTGLLGFLLSLILTGFDPRPIQFRVAFTIVFSIAWGLIWSIIAVRYFTLTISGSGIKGYNFWGKYRFVEWKNIKECRTMNLLGLKYLRVFTLDNRSPLWVLLFLNHMHDFEEDIIMLADQGNPMRSYFETRSA